MKDDSLHPWIEPELEARIVALVVGEASDFETEELERLIAEKSELGLFRQRMESLHGMLRANREGESVPDAGDWRLSEERREKLIAVLGEGSSGNKLEKTNRETGKQKRRKALPLLLKTAAVVAVLGIGAGLMMPASVVVMSRTKKSASDKSEMIAFSEATYQEKDADSLVLSSLDPSPEELIRKEVPQAVGGGVVEADRERRYAQIGHGGYDAKGRGSDEVAVGAPVIATSSPSGAVRIAGDSDSYGMADGGIAVDGLASGQTVADASNITVTAGGNLELFPAGQALERSIDDSQSIVSANGQQNNARARMDYYDKAYNHTRSRILREVAEGWESPVPQAAKSDEGNAHSLEKLAAVSEQSEREGMHWGFGVRGDDSELKFPEEPAARVTNTGSIRGGRVSAELPGLNQSRVFGSEGSVDLGTDGVSVGYASDFAFVNSRDASERETLKKQHGGTVKIDGAVGESQLAENDVLHGGVALSVDFGNEESKLNETGRFHIGASASGEAWGEVDSEIEELGDIELQSKVDSLKVGRVMTRGQGLTKDTVIRRELPALVNKPVSAVEVDARRFRIGGGYQGVEPSGRDSYQSGLRSGAAALDADTIDALIQAASFQAIPATLSEDSAQGKPLSTFSLHVSDVSFKLAQAALAKGEWPDAERIRIEEFVNAFDYGDPLPSQEEKVAANLEQTIHPFLQQRNLLRVSMRTAATGRNSSTPLHLTFLLDNSGSMERADRRETVQKAFALLASMLQPADQITLISFARQPRLLADRMSGDQVAGLVETVRNLPSEGGTNLEAALALAFEKAKEQQLPGAQNRIILLTDGAANLGDAEPQRLADKVEQMRDAGIAFDAAGIGTEGLNDEILEALTRKGDGRYYLLDKADDVDGGFAKQIAGALRPAAGNVKVQIEFNPDRVGKYKLLGFEKHRLKKEDFRNDKIDAAELAAAEAGVAVYQIETKPDGKGDIGSAFVRFRDMATGEMTERRWTIPYQSHPSRPAAAAPSMQVAAVAVMLGAKLKGDALGEVVDLEALLQIVSELPEAWREKPRVVELKTMLESARAIVGE